MTWLFHTPTEDRWTRLAGHGLYAVTAWAKTVYRSGGVWVAQFTPTVEQLAAADRVYLGGREHRIDSTQRDELLAAGFTDITPVEA